MSSKQQIPPHHNTYQTYGDVKTCDRVLLDGKIVDCTSVGSNNKIVSQRLGLGSDEVHGNGKANVDADGKCAEYAVSEELGFGKDEEGCSDSVQYSEGYEISGKLGFGKDSVHDGYNIIRKETDLYKDVPMLSALLKLIMNVRKYPKLQIYAYLFVHGIGCEIEGYRNVVVNYVSYDYKNTLPSGYGTVDIPNEVMINYETFFEHHNRVAETFGYKTHNLTKKAFKRHITVADVGSFQEHGSIIKMHPCEKFDKMLILATLLTKFESYKLRMISSFTDMFCSFNGSKLTCI